jgi:hypothetical protein
MTVPQHMLSKQSSVPATNSPATKDMPKATSITPTRAIPQRAGTNSSHPVPKNVVKTIADKPGVEEGEYDGSGLYSPEANKLGSYFIKEFGLTNEMDQQLAIEIVDNCLEGGLTDPKQIRKQVIKYLKQSGTVIQSQKPGVAESGASQATAMQVYQYMIRQAPDFMKTAPTADVKKAIAKAMSYGSQISVPDLASYAYGILKTNDLDEGWKSALGGAALAGAMALGGSGAHAQSTPSGEDFLPEIVAHVTFKIDGNTVTKDINLGNSFKSPGQASAALEKFLKSKGIKFYEFSIERVKSKNPDYLEKTPASDTGASGSMDSGPYSASGSSDNYMAKESIDEAVARAVKSMSEDGYEFIEAANPAQQAAIAISMKKAGKKPKTEEKVRLDPKCWTGKKIGNPKTKMKGGVRVNNCVPK